MKRESNDISPRNDRCDYCGGELGDTFVIRGNHVICEECNNAVQDCSRANYRPSGGDEKDSPHDAKSL